MICYWGGMVEERADPILKTIRQQDAAIHVADARAPAEGHGEVELLAQDLERLGHAGLAAGTEPVDECATDHHAFRSERDRLQRVLARVNAAVHQHLDLRADGI